MRRLMKEVEYQWWLADEEVWQLRQHLVCGGIVVMVVAAQNSKDYVDRWSGGETCL